MSNLKSRLKGIEKAIDLNKELFPEMPNFSKMSDEQLDSYIIGFLNESHIKEKIHSFSDAKKLYDCYLSKELMTKQEYELILKAEKEFWEQANKPENKDKPVFFIE